MAPAVESNFHLAPFLELKIFTVVCNDACWLAFRCQIHFGDVYPFLVVAEFRTYHSSHQLMPNPSLNPL